MFHKLREKRGLPGYGQRDHRGAVLWHATRMQLRAKAAETAETAETGHDIRLALRKVLHEADLDREKWAAFASDWKQMRLIAMTAIEVGKVFARGAYDAETCAPFPPRGLLPLDQAKKCVMIQLPGGGPDGTAPDGGTTLALQPLIDDEQCEEACDLKKCGGHLLIAAIKRPCWVWAFAASNPSESMGATAQGAPLESVPALADRQFKNFLEYISYFHQSWARFGELNKAFKAIHLERPLGEYELQHAAAILLGGAESRAAKAAIKHCTPDDKATIFTLITYVARTELEKMKKRQSVETDRSARARGNKALKNPLLQTEEEKKVEEAKKKREEKHPKQGSRESTLEALKAGQAARRRGSTTSSGGRSGGGGGGGGSTSLSHSGGLGSPPARSDGQQVWYRVRKPVKVQRDHDDDVDDVDHEAVLLDRSAGAARKLEMLRQSTGMTLQAGEIIQVLEPRRKGKDGVYYVRFSGGWITDDGSVLIPCKEPTIAGARDSTSPRASHTTVAWSKPVAGSREEQAKAFKAHHHNESEDWSHGWIDHRTKAPTVDNPAREKYLTALEGWDDAKVRGWLQRKGLSKLAKPFADEGFNGRGLAALYRMTHLAPGETPLSVEYTTLFRQRIEQLLVGGGGGGTMAADGSWRKAMDATWRNFDSALREQCGEKAFDRLTRDTARRITEAQASASAEVEAARSKQGERSPTTALKPGDLPRVATMGSSWTAGHGSAGLSETKLQERQRELEESQQKAGADERARKKKWDRRIDESRVRRTRASAYGSEFSDDDDGDEEEDYGGDDSVDAELRSRAGGGRPAAAAAAAAQPLTLAPAEDATLSFASPIRPTASVEASNRRVDAGISAGVGGSPLDQRTSEWLDTSQVLSPH